MSFSVTLEDSFAIDINMALKFLLVVISIFVTLADSFVVDFPHDPKSRCPQYWVDATHVDMVNSKFSFMKYYLEKYK